MIYLYGYLSVGLVVLTFVFVADRLSKKKGYTTTYELFESMEPDRERRTYRILVDTIVPFLAACLIVLVWPVAIYMKVTEPEKSERETPFKIPREFAVERQHLLERLTVQEIEQRELVDDPIRAVPDLPFGHLHRAWKEFLNGYPESGELWSFSAVGEWGWRQELRSGYVKVQDKAIGAHFLTLRKDITDAADATDSDKVQA